MLTGKETVAPPAQVEGLHDMTSTIQRNFDALFQAGHTHSRRTTAPSATEGNIGDIFLVELGTSAYLYAKFPTLGWKRILLS